MLKDIYIKIGNICIYKKKLISMICFLSLLICFVSGMSFYKFSKLQDCENKLRYLEQKSITTIAKRKEIKDFIEKKSAFDKHFIENKLESLIFLQNEKTILSKLLLHPAFSNSFQIKKRINFISSDQNRLKFLEENIKKTNSIKESDLVQLKNIEIDDIDLQKLLSIIEDMKIGEYTPIVHSPQLLIKNFSLSKKKENIFSLNMKILKREFLR